MERLTPGDAWFLYLEGPTVPLHVTGLLFLDPTTAPRPLTFARFRRHIERRLDRIPALRRRLVEVPLGIDHPCWVEDENFRLSDHVHHRSLGGTGTADDLIELAGELAAIHLDRSRPLWDFTFVDGLADGSAAAVLKMHHCTVDGVTGMEVLAHLLDLTPDPPRTRHRDTWTPEPVPEPGDVVLDAARSRLGDPMRAVHAAADAAGALARAATTSVQRRLRGAEPVAHPINAPRTRFNATLTDRRQVAVARTPLADLKAIARACTVTINDVVLAACTLGLRDWLQANDHIPDRALICSVPVSIHGPRANADSANQVSTMFVHLPVQLADALEVLEVVHHDGKAAKEVHGSLGADVISDLIDLTPATLFRAAVRLYSQAGLADHMAPVHNLVVSNVMGPTFPTYLVGAQVAAMCPFGPLMEGAGLNITVVSNNGDLDVGLLGCPDLVPDLDGLLAGIVGGIATLCRAAAEHAPAD